jgi:hypothetical protein
MAAARASASTTATTTTPATLDDLNEARRRLSRLFRRQKMQMLERSLGSSSSSSEAEEEEEEEEEHDNGGRSSSRSRSHSSLLPPPAPPPPTPPSPAGDTLPFSPAAAAAARLSTDGGIDPLELGLALGRAAADAAAGAMSASSSSRPRRDSSSSQPDTTAAALRRAALEAQFSRADAGVVRGLPGREQPEQRAAALTGAIKRCSGWRQVRALALRYAGEMSALHACATLVHVAQLQRRRRRSKSGGQKAAGSSSSSSSSRRAATKEAEQQQQHDDDLADDDDDPEALQRFVRHELLALVAARLPSCSPRQAANALWACGALGCGAADPAAHAALLRRAEALASHFAPEHASMALWGAAALARADPGRAPPKGWAEAVASASARGAGGGALSAATPKHLAVQAWSVAALGASPPEAWLQSLVRAVTAQAAAYTGGVGVVVGAGSSVVAVAAASPAAAAASSPSSASATTTTTTTPTHPPRWTGQDVQMLVWALTVTDPRSAQAALPALLSVAGSPAVLASADPPALAVTAWALATLGYRPPERWMALFLARVTAAAPSFDGHAAASMLWALAALCVLPRRECLAALLRAAGRALPTMRPSSLAAALWALAVLEVPPPGEDDEEEEEDRVVEDEHHPLGHSAGTSFEEGEQDEGNKRRSSSWRQRYWRASLAALPAMPPAALASTLWAAARLGLRPPAAWSRAAQAALLSSSPAVAPVAKAAGGGNAAASTGGLARMNSQGAANTLWAAARLALAEAPRHGRASLYERLLRRQLERQRMQGGVAATAAAAQQQQQQQRRPAWDSPAVLEAVLRRVEELERVAAAGAAATGAASPASAAAASATAPSSSSSSSLPMRAEEVAGCLHALTLLSEAAERRRRLAEEEQDEHDDNSGSAAAAHARERQDEAEGAALRARLAERLLGSLAPRALLESAGPQELATIMRCAVALGPAGVIAGRGGGGDAEVGGGSEGASDGAAPARSPTTTATATTVLARLPDAAFVGRWLRCAQRSLPTARPVDLAQYAWCLARLHRAGVDLNASAAEAEAEEAADEAEAAQVASADASPAAAKPAAGAPRRGGPKSSGAAAKGGDSTSSPSAPSPAPAHHHHRHHHAPPPSPLPPQWLADWYVASYRAMPRFSARDLSMSAWALGALRVSPPPEAAWLARFFAVAQARVLAPAAVATTAGAAASSSTTPSSITLPLGPGPGFDGVFSLALPREATRSSAAQHHHHHHPPRPSADRAPQQMANALWALGRLRTRPPDAWAAAYFSASRAGGLPQRHSPQELSNVLWAAAVLNLHPPREWLRDAAAAVARSLRAFDPAGELPVALWALSRLRADVDASLMAPALRRCFGAARRLSPRAWCMALWALGEAAAGGAGAEGGGVARVASASGGGGGGGAALAVRRARVAAAQAAAAEVRAKEMEVKAEADQALAASALAARAKANEAATKAAQAAAALAEASAASSARSSAPSSSSSWADKLLVATGARMAAFSALELSMVATSFARLEARPPPGWVSAFCAHALDTGVVVGVAGHSTSQALPTTNTPAAPAPSPPPPSLRAFGPQALANTIWALATFGAAPPEEWRRAAAARLGALLPRMTPAQLAMVAWAAEWRGWWGEDDEEVEGVGEGEAPSPPSLRAMVVARAEASGGAAYALRAARMTERARRVCASGG